MRDFISLGEGKGGSYLGERGQDCERIPPVKPVGITGVFSLDNGVKQNTKENGCQNHLADQLLPQLLEKVDQDLATAIRVQGCGHCGGKLHSAAIRRKPRGLPEGIRWDTRFSFCCDREGCRRRATPPSVRFLGRRVYAGFVVVLLAAMRHGLSVARMSRLREVTGAHSRTVQRWRAF